MDGEVEAWANFMVVAETKDWTFYDIRAMASGRDLYHTDAQRWRATTGFAG